MAEAPHIPFAREPSLVHEQAHALGGESIRLPFGGRAYNPGLVRLPVEHRGTLNGATYLACVRVQPIEHAKVFTASKLELCGLSDEFEVVWTKPLNLPDLNQEGTPTIEDGRLILSTAFLGVTSPVLLNSYEMTLLCAYTQARFIDTTITKRLTFKQALSHVKITTDGISMMMSPIELEPFYNNSHSTSFSEKNWQFFWDEVTLRFIYSFNPFVVRSVNRAYPESRRAYDSLRWWELSWGEPHGGTPPVLLPNGEYLTFFNSFVQHPRYQRRYVVGALTFTMHGHHAVPRRITSQPLLVGTEREGFLWASRAYWEPLVTFATGCVLEWPSLLLAVGVNDCWSHIVKLPVHEVLRRMTPVK